MSVTQVFCLSLRDYYIFFKLMCVNQTALQDSCILKTEHSLPHLAIKGEKRVHSNEKNHHPCCGTLHIDIDQAGLHTGFSHNGLHLAGNVVETVVGRRADLYYLLHFG